MKSYLLPVVCFFVSLSVQPVWSQCCCSGYQVMTQVIYEPQPTTSYRLVYDTVYEQRKVVSYRPVWETQTQERRYRVTKPITETSYREQRTMVKKPVWETQTTPQQYTVRNPVQEITTQTQTYTAYEPVTTTHTQYVDQGQFVNQTQHTPGPVRRRLRFRHRQNYNDPNTGLARWQRAGLYWVPTAGRGTTKVNRAWIPNVVAQEIPQTTYKTVQKTREVQVPVTRYEEQIVTRDVQQQVLKWIEEEQVQQIPETSVRYETEEHVEPVQVLVCKMVAQEQTIMVPRCVARWEPVTVSCMRPRTVVMRVPDRRVENGSGRGDHRGTAPADNLAQGPALQHSVLKTISTADDPVPVKVSADERPDATDISSFFGLGQSVRKG